jgi:hypothetical protein
MKNWFYHSQIRLPNIKSSFKMSLTLSLFWSAEAKEKGDLTLSLLFFVCESQSPAPRFRRKNQVQRTCAFLHGPINQQGASLSWSEL